MQVPTHINRHSLIIEARGQTKFILAVAKAMKTYGGSFVQALGQAFIFADPINKEKLIACFDEYFVKYGNDVAKKEAPAGAEASVVE